MKMNDECGGSPARIRLVQITGFVPEYEADRTSHSKLSSLGALLVSASENQLREQAWDDYAWFTMGLGTALLITACVAFLV